MGAIQSAINSGLTTTAAALGAAKKINTDAKKSKLEMESLKADKTIELADIENKISSTEENIKKNEDFQKNAPGIPSDREDVSYDPATGKVMHKEDLWSNQSELKAHATYNKNKMLNAHKLLELNLEGLKMQRDAITNFLKGGKK